jgi:hypothetical protein
MGPGFPYPADAGGDVKNLVGYQGYFDPVSGTYVNNDSVWVDLGYPVKVAADGTKYKPLFAFFILDMDGRVNINTSGNIRESGNANASNHGFGPYEMNPRSLVRLTDSQLAAKQAEFANLFLGIMSPTAVPGKYGNDQLPSASPTPAWAPGKDALTPGVLPHAYAPVDWDGCNDGPSGSATAAFQPPSGTALFPTFPAGYFNGSSANPPGNERVAHPALFDVFRPSLSDDQPFGYQDLQALYASGYTANNLQNSRLGQLMSKTLGEANASLFVRYLLTTHSFDVGRPGLTPWLFNRNSTSYTVAAGNTGVTPFVSPPPSGAPTSVAVGFPPLTNRANPLPTNNTDFDLDWRFDTRGLYEAGLSSSNPMPTGPALGRVDLNRFLPPYPHMGQGGYRLVGGQFAFDPADPTLPYKNTPVSGFAGRFDSDQMTSGPIYTQFLAAQTARQQLASDIYRRLLMVTGVPAVAAGTEANPSDTDLMPRRWLAQLAVNIVDFIDEDEISTPFNFYTSQDALGNASYNPNAAGTNPEQFRYWVYGTELPRVVLNEILVETNDVKNKPSNQVRAYAELFNTMSAPPDASSQPLDSSVIQLYVPPSGSLTGFAPYRIAVADTTTTGTAGAPLLQLTDASHNDNVLGSPNTVRTQTSDGTTPGTDFAVSTVGTVASPGTPSVPNSIAPQGYYMVAPPSLSGPTRVDYNQWIASPTPIPASGGTIPLLQCTPSAGNPGMQYSFSDSNFNWSIGGTPISDNTNGVTILLRRLANPYLPRTGTDAAPDPANPYITVDYMDGVVPNNQIATYNSRGKMQPFAADKTQVAPQTTYAQTTAGPGGGKVTHSFTATNQPAPASGNYDWLVHLDRQLVSPMELLQVSLYHPHELTHQFIDSGSNKYGHTKVVGAVPWFDPQYRIYRAFEFLDTHSRMAGVSPFGRIPGKVNINTIWDKEIFYALCDAQTSNHFTGAGGDVDTIWTNFVNQRTPNLATTGVSPADLPLFNMSVGNIPANPADPLAPNGLSVNNTFLGPNPGDPTKRLFEPPSATTAPLNGHPWFRYELMNKISNNITTRSNVFAVWITVGFFQVTDDTAMPVKLGAEIGATQSQNIRHQMFAIVDRSNMVIAPSVATLTANVTAGSQQSFTPSAANGTTAGNVPWQIRVGTVLVVDAGVAQETVVISGVDGMGNPVADFKYNHAIGATVTIPGNPGPQSTFNASDPNSAGVVPYSVILQ